MSNKPIDVLPESVDVETEDGDVLFTAVIPNGVKVRFHFPPESALVISRLLRCTAAVVLVGDPKGFDD